jgi:hypothetical protein
MSRGSITGVVGQIKWSYYVAAAINGYTVERIADQWKLRATVVLSDAFKLSQRPLMFVAPFQQGEWRFPIVSCDVHDGQLTATLGPPEAHPRSAA